MKAISDKNLYDWNTIRGGNTNQNNAKVNFSAKGVINWKYLLDSNAENNSLLVAGNNIIIVNSTELIIINELNGQLASKVEGDFKEAIISWNQKIITLEDKGKVLRIRNIPDGKIENECSINSPFWHSITQDNKGNLLCFNRTAKGLFLDIFETDTLTKRGSIEVQKNNIYLPIFNESSVLMPAGNCIRGLDTNWNLEWQAGVSFFSTNIANSLDNHKVCAPLILLDTKTLLTTFLLDAGNKVYIVIDSEKETTHILPIPETCVIAPSTTYAVSTGLKFHTIGYHNQKRHIFSINLEGTLLWKFPLDFDTEYIISDHSGKIILAQNPPIEQWNLYRDAYELHDKCSVKIIDDKGELLFSIPTNAPVKSNFAIGKSGKLFFIADKKIWAIS